MTTENFDVATADKAELREYAATELGIDFPPATGEAKMREAILKETSADEPAVAQAAKPKMVTIEIPAVEGDTGSQPVFVGLNGRSYLIKRGYEVTVPYGVYQILKNAKEKRYKTVIDAHGKRNLESKVVQAYPVQVVI
jgi:hypothetical protein